ncbi:hypothetical protein JMA_39680 (plasmid) [Jeotgalibacillus malaysiensis]|uniref:Uncharacterized protein n=1 Tax=Jeotgalibacillus malaysiensis TaxID=1508404 RepID=A0A0B5AT37_9BACL|nr:hypothetical protein [Jeotgalibacillus malaysiensis]AJD93286.1 hypothetical protein JMA_39680 [Jeotgalibacillus malaysiensis]
MVTKKMGMLILSCILLSGAAMVPLEKNPVLAESSVTDVKAFLEKDMEVMTAQIPFVYESNVYTMALPGEMKSQELANVFLNTDGIEPEFWDNMNTLNQQIREINSSFSMEEDVAKKKAIYEQQLIPKLDVLHTFIESGEEKFLAMERKKKEDETYSDYLYNLNYENDGFDYSHIKDYMDVQRLLIYAYQELYKYEFDETIDKENPSYEVEEKLSEISHYFYMNKLINAFLFDSESYAEMTQYFEAAQ